MSQSFQEDTQPQAQLLPTKDTLTALKSDVTLESSILELCDNSLDAWKRSSSREDEAFIKIDVTHYDERTELIIRDTAGGIPQEDAAMLFGLGKTAKDEISGAIGTFGVGAKKSLVNLGLPFTVASRPEQADNGWSYRITEEWFEDDEDWTVPINTQVDLPPGTTEIRIEDLNYNWNGETASALRERLGQAYNLFLSDKLQNLRKTDYKLNIVVDGDPVAAEEMPDWSYSPFDDIHPRRYENIHIETPELKEPVKLHITVGLLTKKDNQEAGTDIYCQKRKVAGCLRGDVGGFGTGQDRLGNFNARHQRLKVIIELETEGDGQALPWDTQKSSIDRHNPIMRGTEGCRGVYNWVRRTVQAYYDLDADRIPRAFLEPYDSEHPAAKNGGWPVVYDYSDRKKIIAPHRPNTDIPQIKSLSRKAQTHSLLWISCEADLEEWQTDAYRLQLNKESDRNLENLRSVATAPPEEVEERVHEITGRIDELARCHYHNGLVYQERLPDWQRARYNGLIERQENGDLANVKEIPADIPGTVSELAEQVENGKKPTHQKQIVYTGNNLEDESKTTEGAEIFLVLGGDSDDERGAKVLDTSRSEICKQLNLDKDVTDEVLWEEVRQRFESFL